MLAAALTLALTLTGDPPTPPQPAAEERYVRLRRERIQALPAPELPAATVARGNDIDRFIAAALPPDTPFPQPCDDATYLRRAYLDIVGYGPTLDEARRFLDSPDPDKRAALVRSLLDRHAEYADHWTPFWEDALASFPGTVNGGMATHGNYTAWVRAAFEDNRPFDLFAAELLDPTLPRHKPPDWGSDNGARRRVHYILNESHTDTLQTAANVGQVFLGTAMKCASCHNHFENKSWPQTRFVAFAGLFAPHDLEIIRCEQGSGRTAAAAFPFDVPGRQPDLSPDADRRLASLAGWLVDPANPRFTRSIVNRLWKRYLGLGLAEPADDLREPLSASHPALLDYLSHDLARQDYDLKHTIALILTSRTYQARYDGTLEDSTDAGATRQFRSPQLRRLSAEQLIDSIRRAVAQGLPRDARAYLARSTPLARALGKPAIRNEISTARSDNPGIVQGLELLNGPELEGLLSGALLERAAAMAPAQAAHTLYLAALARPPSATESASAAAYIAAAQPGSSDADRCRDLLWCLFLSPEFQYIR